MPNSSSFFEVFTVDPNKAYSPESLGTKEKFWIVHPHLGQCLVKYPRPGTGEDWSEKVAAGLAEAIGLPHASYELAMSADRAASLSRNFVPPNAALIHGNELLKDILPGYGDSVSKFRVSKHTLSVVLTVLGHPEVGLPLGWRSIQGIGHAVEVFVGYLMLDAWISNTDRHHENWGLVYFPLPGTSQSIHLAPTFDHASSLGCHETDLKKRRRLESRDARFGVRAYCEKAKSALYQAQDDPKPLGTHETFSKAAQQYPDAARVWLMILSNVEDSLTARLIEKVPSDRITPVSRVFAQEVLRENRFRLLRFVDELR